MEMSSYQLPHERLIESCWSMWTVRGFEERIMQEMGTGDIPGNTHLYAGEEVAAVGVCLHLREDDYISSSHRGHGHCIAKGCDIDGMMAELFARAVPFPNVRPSPSTSTQNICIDIP